jgi:hypothetical protein
VITGYIDCLEEANDAGARNRCDEDLDIVSAATREAVSILASVEAYETRVTAEAKMTTEAQMTADAQLTAAAQMTAAAPPPAPDPITVSVTLTWGERTDLDLAASLVEGISWDFTPEGTLLADDTVCPDITGREELVLSQPGLYYIAVGVWSGCIIDDDQLPHYASYTVEVQYSDGRSYQIDGTIEGQIWQPVTQVQLP